MQKKIIPFLVVALFTGSTAVAAIPRYTVNNLASLGGTSSQGSSINDFGLISGFSNTQDNANVHAAIWWFGTKRDLGTLGGAGSAVLWPVKNVLGVVSGIAQTDQPNPLNESWSCSAFIGSDGNTCLGFVWAFGKMQALPPLPGGYNSFATGTNNRLQTVGWAENGVHDPNCNVDPSKGLIQVLQFLPVVWGPGRNQISALPLLSGDDSGAATAINDNGDVVGISGTCDQAVGRHTAKHMVLWKNGHAIDIGNLGGDAWNTPMAINRRGDIVGFANTLPGPGFGVHAFYHDYRGGPPIDLGVLPGDTTSQALGINDRGQIVGVSCGGGGCHGFLWKDGVMKDLNELAPGHAGVITDAQDINDLGQITGQACADADSSPPCYTFRADPIPDYHARRH